MKAQSRPRVLSGPWLRLTPRGESAKRTLPLPHSYSQLAEPIASELNSSQLLIAVFLSLFILEEELREIVLWLYVRKLRFTWKEMWFATHGRGIALGELLDCMLLRRRVHRASMVCASYAHRMRMDDYLTRCARYVHGVRTVCARYVHGV